MNTTNRHHRTRHAWLRIAALALAGGLAMSSSADIHVNVSHIGFRQIGDGGSQGLRIGSWVPIVVDVWLVGQEAFDGTLRVAQPDNDGDEAFDSVTVHLRSESGGAMRYFLYVIANPLRQGSSFAVELISTEGDRVEVIANGETVTKAKSAAPWSLVPADSLFILNLATASRSIGKLQDIADLRDTGPFARDVRVGNASAADIPEQWFGMEMIDVIVWDHADPDELSDLQQAAMAEWVRQGGTLLIAGGARGAAIAQNEHFKKILPVTIGGARPETRFGELRFKLLGERLEQDDDDKDKLPAPFSEPIELREITLRKGAKLIHRESSIDADVIARWRVGRGHVIYSAIALDDAFSAGGAARLFFKKVLYLADATDADDPAIASPIFPEVYSTISFTRSGSMYLVIAVVFSLTYLVVATFGSWGFLSAKGWQQHNWTAFSIVAGVASVLSVLAVTTVQGVGHRMHQYSIIDAVAGDTYGYATTLFGLKTGSDTELDVWLPSDHSRETEPGPSKCYLRPVGAGSRLEDVTNSYTDPRAYRLDPGAARIEGVRVRSTLKQFEGRWEGPLGGTIIADVTVTPPKYVSGVFISELTDASYIKNNLGVDLTNCWLLHSAKDIHAYEDNLGRRGPAWAGNDSRAGSVYAYPLGDLPADGQRKYLAAICYQPKPGQKQEDAILENALSIRQLAWAKPFRSTLLTPFTGGGDSVSALGKEQEALLMLSTVGDIDVGKFNPTGSMGFQFGRTTISRERLRHLDLREQLERDCVYLIGFAADPGPVRLMTRSTGGGAYRVARPVPGKCGVMYRIRIPVKFTNAPPARASDDESKIDGGSKG